MTYKGPGGYGRIVNIIMNIFMSAAMSYFMLWTAQQRAGEMAQVLTPTAFALSFVTAFCIGFTVADLIPVFKAGSSVARKFGLKGVPAYMVTVLVIDLIVTTIIGFCMTMINMTERVGFVGAFMSWLGTYPITLVFCYVIQLIIMKPAMSFAKKASGFDPDNPTPPFGGPGMPGALGGPGMAGAPGGPGMAGAPGGPGMPPASAPGRPGAAGSPGDREPLAHPGDREPPTCRQRTCPTGPTDRNLPTCRQRTCLVALTRHRRRREKLQPHAKHPLAPAIHPKRPLPATSSGGFGWSQPLEGRKQRRTSIERGFRVEKPPLPTSRRNVCAGRI